MFFITLIAFLIILGLLIFVHEAGHFSAAKLSDVTVEEFAFGFPPRLFGFQLKRPEKTKELVTHEEIKIEIQDIKSGSTENIKETITENFDSKEKNRWKWQWKFAWGPKSVSKLINSGIENDQTTYAVNLIPFGGYVKMLGEDEVDSSPKSFSKKRTRFRFLIVVAGVIMNFLLGGLLLSLGYGIGMSPISINENEFNNVKTSKVLIAQVNAGSPAEISGLEVGDVIVGFNGIDQFASFTKENLNKSITVEVNRKGKILDKNVQVSANQEAPIGVGLADLSFVKLSFFPAIYYGFKDMILTSKNVVIALYLIVIGLFTTGKVSEAVSGPVGIFNITGQAVKLGFTYLVQLAALLSINLAIINILPFPGLDGSRALILALEGIFRKKVIRSEVESILHMIGFIILIVLILLVTFRDILQIV